MDGPLYCTESLCFYVWPGTIAVIMYARVCDLQAKTWPWRSYRLRSVQSSTRLPSWLTTVDLIRSRALATGIYIPGGQSTSEQRTASAPSSSLVQTSVFILALSLFHDPLLCSWLFAGRRRAAEAQCTRSIRLGYKLCAVIRVASQGTHGTAFRALKITAQVATPGAESAVYDCLVSHVKMLSL